MKFYVVCRDAWKRHGDMPREKAMMLYVRQLDETEPHWESKQFDADDNAPVSTPSP